MKRIASFSLIPLLAVCAAGWGQSSGGAVSPAAGGGSYGVGDRYPAARKPASVPTSPFSRIAIGGGFSPLGVHLLAATNLNPHLDVRGNGNFFRYSVGDISTSGFTISPQLNLASAGATLDVYPFAGHGFRLSPGALFYNTNQASSAVVAQPGASFTLKRPRLLFLGFEPGDRHGEPEPAPAEPGLHHHDRVGQLFPRARRTLVFSVRNWSGVYRLAHGEHEAYVGTGVRLHGCELR